MCFKHIHNSIASCTLQIGCVQLSFFDLLDADVHNHRLQGRQLIIDMISDFFLLKAVNNQY